MSTCSEFSNNTTNFNSVIYQDNLIKHDISPYCFSEFDVNGVMKEFCDYSPFLNIKTNLIDEKTKDRIFNFKTGTKFKNKISLDIEKLKNWKFEEKLKESIKFKFIFSW